MKHRREGKKRKSKIQTPALTHPRTLELCLMEGLQSGYRYRWKVKIWHRGRTGLPVVIDTLNLDKCRYIYESPLMDIESYLREEFGSGEFEAVFYDENDVERGKYKCPVGGAEEYIHPSEYVDQELEDIKNMAKLVSIMAPNRDDTELYMLLLLALSQNRRRYSGKPGNTPVETPKSQEQSPGRPIWIDQETAKAFKGLSRLNAQTVADTRSSTVDQAATTHPHDADSEAAHQIKQPTHPSESDDRS